ncbi:MAG TPA: hybrid sensor histidine kinase/response regulator, partial [Allocoleopsis sp.]
IPGLRSRLEDVLINNTNLQNFEVEHDFERIGHKVMLLNAWRIIQTEETQRILLAIEDVTEHKQFETERSQLLHQEQAARQEAESANRAKDEFLSNLSHELRNPLTVMLAWSQILQNRRLDEATVAQGLKFIEQSAKSQLQLIEDMLDLSRITSGKLHLNLTLLDLASIVHLAIGSAQLSAEAKNIQIVSQLSATTILGDVDRLQQVLWNLLSNAIKFTPSGGRIEITVAPVETDAEIRVSDTGQGISAELLPYVFDRFRQGDSSTTKAKQGLGLGLAIVRHIVELHGGTVRAESLGEGQGTTFTVRLPLRPTPLEVMPPSNLELPAEESLESINQPVPSLAGLRILAVDDEVAILKLMKHILEAVGATVETVTSVREAIAALINAPSRYDVLLADIGMPDEDGFALMRQVRALDTELGGQIPAAAITAYVSDREQQQAIDAGFQMHMAKPINPTQLIWTVATLVGRVSQEGTQGQDQ